MVTAMTEMMGANMVTMNGMPVVPVVSMVAVAGTMV